MAAPKASGGGDEEGRAGNHRLGRRHRLIHSREFAEVFAKGSRHAGRLMILGIFKAPDRPCRLGVVTSRRIGGAVIRNRARRRLREVFRLHREALRDVSAVILVARPGCAEAPWGELVEEFRRLARRAGIAKSPESAGNP